MITYLTVSYLALCSQTSRLFLNDSNKKIRPTWWSNKSCRDLVQTYMHPYSIYKIFLFFFSWLTKFILSLVLLITIELFYRWFYVNIYAASTRQLLCLCSATGSTFCLISYTQLGQSLFTLQRRLYAVPCVPTKPFQRCARRERQGKLALPCTHGQPYMEKAAVAAQRNGSACGHSHSCQSW